MDFYEMKKAIRYIRISKEKQSNFSIEAQDMYTSGWCERNDVEIVGTFTDDGYTAQNFDRPDFQKLELFIKEFHRTVDFLVVNSFDRFSRDAGEALMKIKHLQNKWNINVVSVVEGVTFDRNDPGSFFYTGLLLLKGEDEIIRHKYRINMGIYTAKKKFGRYLGKAPWGYINTKDDTGRPTLKIDERKAEVIKYVFKAYLLNTPMYIIREDVDKMTDLLKSNSVIKRILTNPAYCSLLRVTSVRDLPGGMVEGSWEPIIDRSTWQIVQEKLTGGRPKLIIAEDIPLRGVISCHCGKRLTGAASTGKSGKKFNYYKCPVKSSHNNVSAIKAHAQLVEVFSLMSLPDHIVQAISTRAEEGLKVQLRENEKIITDKRQEIIEAEKHLASIEEKYIADKLQFDTYNRWHTHYTQRKIDLKTQVEKLSADKTQIWMLLQTELQKLTDLASIYQKASTVQKQGLVRGVFDNKLYYQAGVYRTPYIMPVFTHNTLIMKEKNLLIYEKPEGSAMEIPSGGAGGTTIEHLFQFLQLVKGIRVA